MWIRNSLTQALRNFESINLRSLPGNLVYQYTSILKLADFLSRLNHLKDAAESRHQDQIDKTDQMLALVEKYRSDFRTHVPFYNIKRPAKHTVLVTGTTGGLGTALLAAMVAADDILRVYAFNRKASDGTTLQSRQEDSLRAQGHDIGIATSKKVVLIEGDISQPTLGVSSDVFETVSLSPSSFRIHPRPSYPAVP